MSYYDNRESVVNIYHGLVERGWKCYGYKANESDPYTDYYSPAYWNGVAEKNGFILLVDVSGTHYSGYKKTKQGYTPDYEKIEKLRATINDKAASQNEKETSQKIIDSMMNKQKESNIVIEEYPTFKQGNPKGSNWHIEKDGNIIAKGKGAFQCDGYLFGEYEAETMKKVNAFLDKVESKINGSEELQEVQKKVIKKVIKPIEVTDRKTLQVGDVLSFSYHGHYWVVISVNEKTFTYELLGSEKRGYQRLTNGKRYYDYMTKFEKNLESGNIKLYELKEVEEVTYKTTYKAVKRQGQKENLLPVEEVAATQEGTKENNHVQENEKVITAEEPKNEGEIKSETIEAGITYQTGTGAKGNGIEITFPSKPDEETRNAMKANGYRWGGRNRSNIWWAVLTDDSLTLAKQIAGEGNSEEETKDLNNVEIIMNDLSNIDITAEQKERIQTLLTHWNNKKMAVLEAIYDQGNGNIILKAEDKRKNVTTKIRYIRLFAGGEVATGLSPKQDEMEKNSYPVIYNVKESQNVHNSNITGETAYNSQLTPEQQETLRTRLQKEHVKPLKLYKSHNSDSILFECENLKLAEDVRKPFYFIIQSKGNELGKGYDYPVNEYELFYTFDHNSEETQEQPKSSITETQKYHYEDIEIDDCMDEKYNISQQLQDREHDANWIFRSKKRDHNQELQQLFQGYTDKVKEIISTLENEYYIYKIKSILQSFKKNYHSAYVNYLSAKASQPHWAVSGRGNLSKSRYEKAINRQDKWMSELVNLPKEFESKLNYYKNKEYKDKERQLKEQLQEQLKQPLPDVEFKTITKELDIYGNGNKVRTRIYECEGYYTFKNWGAWRVYNSQGKEIWSTKSAGTLNDAKAYIVLQIKEKQLQAV